jgi:hypothetical protein
MTVKKMRPAVATGWAFNQINPRQRLESTTPPMKLEDFSNLYFVVSVLVPGFIYSGVVANFIPMRRSKEKEILLLRYLTATAFNYALCSPLIYLLTFGLIFPKRPFWQALCWFAIIFIVPVILAVAHARIMQKDGMGWLYHLVGLRAISPIPTGMGLDFQHDRAMLRADHPDRWHRDSGILWGAIHGVLRTGAQRHIHRAGV